MDGVRKASAHEIVFQAREGAPELNCCSVNAARGLGLIADWAAAAEDDGVRVNWLGPSTLGVRVAGRSLKLTQRTDYPRSGAISLQVEGDPGRCALRVRIPHWSANSRWRVNTEDWRPAEAGKYLEIVRDWRPGDTVGLELDMSPHFWVGERESAGLVSAYRGPLLLTYDRRFNTMDPRLAPALPAKAFPGQAAEWTGWGAPWLLLEVPAADGQAVRLCDFASAGQAGSPYRSWLPITGAVKTEFSRRNPLRAARAP
jgi:DUF1680 family protein